MDNCRFLETKQIKDQTIEGFKTITSYRCKLGHYIPLDGCRDNCPDYEPQIPNHHQLPTL
jgi:hypothetical protein